MRLHSDGFVVNLVHSGSKLTQVVEHDPDGVGPLLSSVTQFGYGNDNITSWTTPEGEQTTITYNARDSVTGYTTPAGGTYTISSYWDEMWEVYESGVNNPAASYDLYEEPEYVPGDPIPTDHLVGTISHPGPGNRVTTMQFDRYARPVVVITPDGTETRTARGGLHGLAQGVSIHDTSGSGDVYATNYTYNFKGQRTSMTEPNGAVHTWVPQLSTGLPLEYTDPLSVETIFTRDSNGNATRALIKAGGGGTTSGGPGGPGGPGGGGPSIGGNPDDLIFDYTYTPGGNGQLAGQIASVTIPADSQVPGDADYVVTYQYADYSFLSKIQEGVGTADQRELLFTYDIQGLPEDTTDAEGNVTTYTYDDALRLVSIQLPIAGVGLAAPVYAMQYDRNDRLIKTIDAEGRVSETEYDSAGRVSKTILPDHDSDGNTTDTTFAYEPGLYRLDKITDPLSRETEFDYDVMDRTTLVRQPDPGTGQHGRPVTTTTYDFLSRVTSTTDPLSRTTTTEYNQFGDSVVVTLPQTTAGTRVWTYAYDVRGDLVSVTDPRNNVSQNEYDFAHRLVKTIAPDPLSGQHGTPITEFEYDTKSRLTNATDPRGNVVSYEYDGRNRPVEVTLPDPDGVGPLVSPVYESEYDDNDRLTKSFNAYGVPTDYEYDGRNQLVKMTGPDPDGSGPQQRAEMTYEFDILDRLTGTTNARGGQFNYGYDTLDHRVSSTIIDPDGPGGPRTDATTTYDYDDMSNLIRSTSAVGGVSDYEYDDLNRLVTDSMPAPGLGTSTPRAETKFTYDIASQLLVSSKQNSAGANFEDSYGYNPAGQVVQSTNPVNKTRSYSYDTLDRLTSVSDENDNTTNYGLDELGRVLSETDQLGNVRSYSYDVNGNLIQRVDANSRTTSYTYDLLDRLTGESWSGTNPSPVSTISYGYDVASQMTAAKDSINNISMTYDEAGRLTGTNQEFAALGGAEIGMVNGYTTAGDRSYLQTKIAGQNDARSIYSYDTLGNFTAIAQRSLPSGNAVRQKRVVFEYDNNQRQRVIRNFEYDGTNQEEAYIRINTWDDANQLIRVANRKGSKFYTSTNYRINNVGFLFKEESNDGNTDYRYDRDGQLLEADYPGAQPDELFQYDPARNRINSNGEVIGDDNRLLENATHVFTYDNEGNRTSKTDKVTGESESYVWDHRNRLIQIQLRNGSNVLTKTINYSYDALDRRVNKEIIEFGTTTDETYAYDGQHITLRFKDGVLSNRYLHGQAIDQILADEVVPTGGGAGDIYWMLTDNLGTVEGTLDYDTQTNQSTVVNKITHNAFGEIESETNASAVDHIFGYTGRERDDESSLNYYRARYYDSDAGRFISEDPISFAAGDANLYRYVGNGPTDATDPSGLQEVEEFRWRNGRYDFVVLRERGRYFVQKYDIGNAWNIFATPKLVSNVQIDGTAWADGHNPELVQILLRNHLAIENLAAAGECAVDMSIATMQAAIVIGTVVVPGPDELILAGLAAKFGGKFQIMGGKLCCDGAVVWDKADEAKYVAEAQRVVKNAPRKVPTPSMKSSPFGPKIEDAIPRDGVPKN